VNPGKEFDKLSQSGNFSLRSGCPLWRGTYFASAAVAVSHGLEFSARKLPLNVEASVDAEFIAGATSWAAHTGGRKRALWSAQHNQ